MGMGDNEAEERARRSASVGIILFLDAQAISGCRAPDDPAGEVKP
jgi:hypothetical protein